jgi:tetratricopeptide (TPR) repeat protein
VEAPPPGLPFLDDDAAARDALAQEFLSHRERDVFDLLGVSVDANVATLQKAYLAKAQALPPVRFKTAELRQRAEAVALAYARAFGALVEPDVAKMHRKRREVAEEALRLPNRPSTADQFRIQTNLLDAGTQFEDGKKRLAAGNFRGAAEHFEFACDIEPKGTYQAYLAWAKFRADPDRGAKAALAQLAEVCESEPDCEEAWAFRADLARAIGQPQLADEGYRRAYKINPQQKRYADALRELARSRKS